MKQSTTCLRGALVLFHGAQPAPADAAAQPWRRGVINRAAVGGQGQYHGSVGRALERAGEAEVDRGGAGAGVAGHRQAMTSSEKSSK